MITDGAESGASKINKEALKALMLLIGRKFPKEVLKTVFIGIDLESDRQANADLNELKILGGETAEIYNASNANLD